MSSLSIVTTLYNSKNYIDDFYKRSIDSAEKDFDEIEIIFVNDASPDNSLSKCKQLFSLDRRIKIIDLAINAGHHKAIMTGLKYASNDYVWLIDIDLEESPEWLNLFYEEIKKRNCDVIYGEQLARKGGIFEVLTGKLFFSFMKYNSHAKFQNNATTARIMTKRYVKRLCEFKEYYPILNGLWSITGFDQKSILVKKLSHSKTTYKLSHKFQLALEAILSFSTTPIKLIAYTGLLSIIISFIVLFILIISYLSKDSVLVGWTSIMGSIWFFGGLITASIALIGIYVVKIYIEVKQRPYTIIKEIIQHE